MKTDKLFTGQREMAGLGIYHYGARFYSPKLGRFLSADIMVPSLGNPQNLNRFSYVMNNPLRYIDPTGHRPDDGCRNDGGCNITSQTISDDYKRDKDFKDTTARNKCKAGNKLHCSYAQNHPVETVLFVSTALIGGAALETFVLEGGAAATADVLCSAVCRAITGMAGGAEAADAGNSSSAWQFPSKGPITQNGITFSKHALERMLPVGLGGRGVPPSVVENVVTTGQSAPTLTQNVVEIVSENVTVIYNTITNTVITVIKTGH